MNLHINLVQNIHASGPEKGKPIITTGPAALVPDTQYVNGQQFGNAVGVMSSPATFDYYLSRFDTICEQAMSPTGLWSSSKPTPWATWWDSEQVNYSPYDGNALCAGGNWTEQHYSTALGALVAQAMYRVRNRFGAKHRFGCYALPPLAPHVASDTSNPKNVESRNKWKEWCRRNQWVAASGTVFHCMYLCKNDDPAWYGPVIDRFREAFPGAEIVPVIRLRYEDAWGVTITQERQQAYLGVLAGRQIADAVIWEDVQHGAATTLVTTGMNAMAVAVAQMPDTTPTP